MNKEEIRQQASISILNSLLETTQHSVVEAPVIKDVYAHIAVWYADALLDALSKDKDNIETYIKNNAEFLGHLKYIKHDKEY